MRLLKTKDFKGGWLVGDFEPSLFKNAHVEVAVKTYQPGDVDKAHVHNVGTEATVIVSGEARIGSFVLREGDVFVIEPGEPMPGDWTVTQPTTTVCIKWPSMPGDKHPVQGGPGRLSLAQE